MPIDEDVASYLEGGRIAKASIGKMFSAAQRIWRLAPWKVAFDGQVVRVDVPRLGVEGACLSIIGNLGESFGILLFPSLRGFEAFAGAAQRSRKRARPDLGTTVLALEFERAAELPASMRREVLRYRWPVAGSDAYPRVTHRDRDAMPRPVTEHDVRLMTAIAISFGAFFAKHRELFERDQIEPVCESYYDEDDLEVRFTAPYDAHEAFQVDQAPISPRPVRRFEPKTPRNAPCRCGSGVKYKKCCLPKDERTETSGPSHVHETDEKLVYAMAAFATERFGARWRRSMNDFVDADSTRQLYLPWAVYCFRLEGRPVVDWFLDACGPRLAPEERAWLAAQKRGWVGIWEVLAVEAGRTVTVRDLLSGKERQVHEVSGSKTLKVRDTILGRVIDMDGLSVFAGIHPRPLPPSEADEVVSGARRKLRIKAAVQTELLREEPFGRFLIKRWERAVADMDARSLIPPVLHNTDGDPFLLTTDHFAFDRERRVDIETGSLRSMVSNRRRETATSRASSSFVRETRCTRIGRRRWSGVR